jgi:hypothetical protein
MAKGVFSVPMRQAEIATIFNLKHNASKEMLNEFT